MTHKVVKVRLRHNTELYEWAASASNTARYVYNNAVSTYLFSGEMAERVVISYKPKKKSKMLHVYAFKGSSKSDRFTLNKELTKLRAEYEWLRKLPVAYGRAAITDAVTACGRVIDDNSDYTSYREDKNRIILGSVSPPIWRNSHLLYLPGFGEVETKCIVDESWDMCSFRLVDVTHHTTRPPFRAGFTIRIVHSGWSMSRTIRHAARSQKTMYLNCTYQYNTIHTTQTAKDRQYERYWCGWKAFGSNC